MHVCATHANLKSISYHIFALSVSLSLSLTLNLSNYAISKFFLLSFAVLIKIFFHFDVFSFRVPFSLSNKCIDIVNVVVVVVVLVIVMLFLSIQWTFQIEYVKDGEMETKMATLPNGIYTYNQQLCRMFKHNKIKTT